MPGFVLRQWLEPLNGAGPTQVGPGIHGYPAGWKAGEPTRGGRFGDGDAGSLDEFALGIENI